MTHQPDSPANPIPQEVREKINEYADKYAFRVPYDGTNNFYDEEALKHFLAGAEFGYSLALPVQSEEGEDEMWDKVIEIVLSDTSWRNEGLVEKLQSQYKLIKK